MCWHLVWPKPVQMHSIYIYEETDTVNMSIDLFMHQQIIMQIPFLCGVFEISHLYVLKIFGWECYTIYVLISIMCSMALILNIWGRFHTHTYFSHFKAYQANSEINLLEILMGNWNISAWVYAESAKQIYHSMERWKFKLYATYACQ